MRSTIEQVGPFALHRLIGSGGSADVYEATDHRTSRTVALKLLSPYVADDDAARSRFLREAKHAARVNDPHVVSIYDFGEVQGRLYISMAFIDGPNLAEVIGTTPLPPERAVRIIGQVASGLAAAHKNGLVHRDVKPSNILMSTDHSGRDYAYLADFGITRSIIAAQTTQITRSGMVVGTGPYLAPEQYSGDADPRSDVYALGCVLYACLTAEVPFPFEGPAAQMLAKLSGSAPPVSRLAPWAGHLDHVVAKALARQPHDRYRSALELAAVAQRAVDMQIFRPLPDPPTVSYRARRARFVGVAIATAAVLLIGVAFGVLSLIDRSEAGPLPVAAPPPPPPPAPELVSTAQPRQISTLPVPGRPETVAINRDGSRAYMTTSDPAAGALHVIDTAANAVIATVPIPGIPRFVVLNPTTDNVYVTYNDADNDELMAAGIEAATNTLVKTISTGQPQDRRSGQTWLFVAAMSQDGTRLYVPHHDRSVVSVLDTTANEPIAQIPMPRNPHSVSITADGRSALVAAHASGEVNVIDLADNSFVRAIPIGSGTAPHDVDISPDGTLAHVANFDAGTVSVIDVASSRVTATVSLGGKPQSVKFSSDGRRSYVVDNATNTLHSIDTGTNAVTGSVQVAPGASMVALSLDGTRAWVSSRDSSLMTTFLTAS